MNARENLLLPQNEELIATLKCLGLTCVQAKSYVTLSILGEATIGTIAKNAQIARQHLYKPMLKLEEMSLVERIIDKPPKYKALPLKEAINILLDKRNKENHELQDKINGLLKNLKKQQKNQMLQNQQERAYTTLIAGLGAFDHESDRALMNAQTCFDGTATVELFRRGMFLSGTYHQEAVKRGVHYRHIISKPENGQFQLGDEDLRNNPLWEVRFSSSPLPFQMTIIDKKEVFISTTSEVKKDCVYYWSNNECFLILAQNYYDFLWGKASEK
jgi:sugar-specific transcriptional regulator TrmB